METLLTTYTRKYARLFPSLNERSKRLVAASDAIMLGYGGVSVIHHASGLDHKTIRAGMKDLQTEETLSPDRCRRPGGGRKKLTDTDTTLLDDLHDLVSDTTRGNPESPLRWTTKSTRVLAEALKEREHTISHVKVADLLHDADYSLQSNRKTKEGTAYPDRDEQFRHIATKSKEYITAGDPVISVDTKKKELVGNFKNNGQTWCKKKQPIEVNIHDFPDDKLGRAVPYGIYEIANDRGYVNVGLNHDTGEFSVASIRRWWQHLGKKRYSASKRLFITADSGGSNGYRLRLWKKELQRFADETKLEITVCHFPPGTSKWNKIEHRLFSFISTNWKGRPLTSYEVIVTLIAATKTKTGLKVYAMLDANHYELKKRVSDAEMKALNIEPNAFHGEWNYTIRPRDG